MVAVSNNKLDAQAIASLFGASEFALSDEQVRSFDFMLTTIDNPFDPFTQFDEWFAFDSRKNYNSSGLLARIAKVPEELGDFQEKLSIVQAMNDIIRLNASGVHTVAVRSPT